MTCPTCGGDMWDNRQKKKNPKAPDFKCKDKSCDGVIWPPKTGEFQKAKATMQEPPQLPAPDEDGVAATLKHLMQTSNLLLLCVKAASYVAENMPEKADTAEQRQSIVAQLFIEASHKRTNDGVNWWSYVDKMPVKPL